MIPLVYVIAQNAKEANNYVPINRKPKGRTHYIYISDPRQLMGVDRKTPVVFTNNCFNHRLYGEIMTALIKKEMEPVHIEDWLEENPLG